MVGMVLLPCPCCSSFKVVDWDRDGAFIIDAEGSCRCALGAEQHRHLVAWGLALLLSRYWRRLAAGPGENRTRMGQGG